MRPKKKSSSDSSSDSSSGGDDDSSDDSSGRYRYDDSDSRSSIDSGYRKKKYYRDDAETDAVDDEDRSSSREEQERLDLKFDGHDASVIRKLGDRGDDEEGSAHSASVSLLARLDRDRDLMETKVRDHIIEKLRISGELDRIRGATLKTLSAPRIEITMVDGKAVTELKSWKTEVIDICKEELEQGNLLTPALVYDFMKKGLLRPSKFQELVEKGRLLPEEVKEMAEQGQLVPEIIEYCLKKELIDFDDVIMMLKNEDIKPEFIGKLAKDGFLTKEQVEGMLDDKLFLARDHEQMLIDTGQFTAEELKSRKRSEPSKMSRLFPEIIVDELKLGDGAANNAAGNDDDDDDVSGYDSDDDEYLEALKNNPAYLRLAMMMRDRALEMIGDRGTLQEDLKAQVEMALKAEEQHEADVIIGDGDSD